MNKITLILLFSSLFSVAQTSVNETEFDNDKKGVEVLSVKTEASQYIITYFDSSGVLKQYKMPFVQGITYSNSVIKYFSAAFMTIPIKVRPAIQDLKQVAKADIKNVGLNLNYLNILKRNYLQNGTMNEYRIAFGGIIAPGVEVFNAANTNGFYTKDTEKSQMILSTGLTVSATYKGVTLSAIPAGVDFGLTPESKNWVYRGKYWYGFGLGLDTKIFGL